MEQRYHRRSFQNSRIQCPTAMQLRNCSISCWQITELTYYQRLSRIGWNEASEMEKEQLTRMNNFFCGLHFLVGLADCAEATLKLWEETYELHVSGKSSGTQRLVRTACKSFHARGSQQAGCSTQFRAYLRNRGVDKMPLAAFRGNRFNVFFLRCSWHLFFESP